MKKNRFIIFLFFISGILCSQPSFDYATQPNSSEEPLGFVKYNTFTMVYTYSKSYNQIQSSGVHGHRVIGFNNDGSIRFEKLHSTSESSGPWQCVPTRDKGMLTLSRTFYCFGTGSQFNGYVFTRFSRIDSTGNLVFVVPPFGNDFSGVTQVSATNFNYTTGNKVVQFNGSTGASVAVVYTTQGTISSVSTTPSQQIIVATNSVVSLIDTLGNLLVSKPSTANYSKIKSYKKTFYGLRISGIIIDKLDSLLNVTDSINTVIVEPVTDFSVYNDSIAVSFYNSGTNLSSIKVYPVNTLSSPLSFLNNIVKHKIVALQRDSTYNILSGEKKTNGAMLCGSFCQFYRYSTGFTRRQSLSVLSYTNDIVLKRIKTQTFTASSISNINYTYQNSLVVQNNSLDTIKYFHISHPMGIVGMGSSLCGAYGYSRMFDTTVVVNLLPNDSIEIQLPLLNSSMFSYSYPGYTISLCYDLSAPNHRLENNILNSSACVDFSSINGIEKFSLTEFSPNIYPNPATNRLSILSSEYAEVYSVIDLSGRIIFAGKNSPEIDISALSSGMYILSFKIKENYFSKKFVKL